MARILVKDLGVRTGKKDGVLMHRMQFSYACDQMESGLDAPMASSFLQTLSHNEKTGKTYTSRDYYLSETIYDRLMRHVSTEGCENSRWTGIVEVDVQKFGTDRGYRQILNFSTAHRPEIPFDERRHNTFVKASQRIAEAQSRLPEALVSVDTEKQFGE